MLSATSAFSFEVSATSASITVPNCWTIDAASKAAGGPDNGYLDCARKHTPGFRSDRTTAEAVNNLVSCLGTRQGFVNIVGHGNDGLIVTGEGQSPSDPQKFITTWNQTTWGPLFRALRGKATVIRLWACHPGTGQTGADLLFAMMQESNATCMGPTGFLYCRSNGFVLEPSSTWQVASPGRPKPNPINAPSVHFTVAFASLKVSDTSAQMISASNVKTVTIRKNENAILSLQDDAAKDFLSLIDFSNPLDIDGVVGALVTGEIVITHNAGGSGEQQVKFTLYNNRLIATDSETPAYYSCSEGFAQALTVGVR